MLVSVIPALTPYSVISVVDRCAQCYFLLFGYTIICTVCIHGVSQRPHFLFFFCFRESSKPSVRCTWRCCCYSACSRWPGPFVHRETATRKRNNAPSVTFSITLYETNFFNLHKILKDSFFFFGFFIFTMFISSHMALDWPIVQET